MLKKRLDYNGTTPVVSMYKQKREPCGRDFNDGTKCKDGYLSETIHNTLIGGKDDILPCPVCNKAANLQPGMVMEFNPPVPIEGQPPPIDLNANPINFFHPPVDILEYIDGRIESIKNEEIKFPLVGKTGEIENSAPKTEQEINRSTDTLRNTLTNLSMNISKVRKRIDFKAIALRFGRERIVKLLTNYGDDFYLETERELRDTLKITDNPIERQNLLNRVNITHFRNNPLELEGVQLEYLLIPYGSQSDMDFLNYVNAGKVSDESIELRTNWTMYKGLFEGKFGKLPVFITTGFSETTSFDDKILTIKEALNALVLTNISRNGQTDNTSLPSDVRQGREL